MPATVKDQLEESVKSLMVLSESELELELGRRLTQTSEELSTLPTLAVVNATGPTMDAEALQDLPAFVRTAATRFLTKFNQQMYSLVCDASDPDNAKIRQAAAGGAEKLGYAISGALVMTFGWMPGIASVIAVIVMKRMAKSGYAAFCETWKEQI